jgi:hypothetical protein
MTPERAAAAARKSSLDDQETNYRGKMFMGPRNPRSGIIRALCPFTDLSGA